MSTNRDWAFEPHGPQCEETPATTADKLRALAAFLAYVAALAIAGGIDKGFAP